MRRLSSLVLALAFLVPAFGQAAEPTDAEIARAVAEMPMPNLTRHLKARAAADRTARHPVEAIARAETPTRPDRLVLAQNRRR